MTPAIAALSTLVTELVSFALLTMNEEAKCAYL